MVTLCNIKISIGSIFPNGSMPTGCCSLQHSQHILDGQHLELKSQETCDQLTLLYYLTLFYMSEVELSPHGSKNLEKTHPGLRNSQISAREYNIMRR